MVKDVLVVTLTCGRLPVSKKYVPQLETKAGHPYRHVIVDNGSTDGTPEWFEAHGYEVVKNETNAGVAKGWDIGYRHAIEDGFDPDYVIRMDDDCDIETDDILAKIVQFYEDRGDDYIVSPTNVPLLSQPKYMPKTIQNKRRLGGWNVNFVTHSGLFVTVPRKAFETMSSTPAGIREGDNRRGLFWRNHGYPTVYLNDLRVHHEGRGTATYDKYHY